MDYYVTTTLPYVNADPHIGFALELVQADALARWHRLLGDEVVFNTGVDEHGLKIFRKATELDLDPQAYCDLYAAKFDGLKTALGLSYTHFTRTTDPHHMAAAQEFWRRCAAADDIYKKEYTVKYCVGCELEKTDSELVDGRCPLHPKLAIETIAEENWFFRWSKYGKKLLAHYEAHPDFVIPEGRLNEIRSFVAGGLRDFSVSRLKTKIPWGVPVPDDAEQVMYVWFDALTNYVSALGWPEDKARFARFWPGVQIAGTDNLRQQSAMWQAMLLSAGLPPSKQVFIHGFITADGEKMSKSLGNVVNPYDFVAAFGTDAVRHFLLGAIPSHQDGDFTRKGIEGHYSSKLANGVGNLTARTLTMIEKYCGGRVPAPSSDPFGTPAFWKSYASALDEYRFDDAVRAVDGQIAACDQAIDREAPWKKAKAGGEVAPFLYALAEALRHVGCALLPIIPEAAARILSSLGIDATAVRFPADQVWGGLAEGTAIRKGDILFPRK